MTSLVLTIAPEAASPAAVMPWVASRSVRGRSSHLKGLKRSLGDGLRPPLTCEPRPPLVQETGAGPVACPSAAREATNPRGSGRAGRGVGVEFSGPVGSFVLVWAAPPQPFLDAGRVVPPVDVNEQGVLRLGPGGPGVAEHQLDLQRRPEILHQSVVIGVPCGPHRRSDTVKAQVFPELERRIVAAL